MPSTCILACAVLEHELKALGQELDEPPWIELLEQGLHNEPDKLRDQLNAQIAALETAHAKLETIVFGYGLCSNALQGVYARRVRLVLPRAHDCITLLLGSKERYQSYVAAHPTAYWFSKGWNEHGNPPCHKRLAETRAGYAADYGEENADYLMETMEGWIHNYDTATFIDLPCYDTAPDRAFTRAAAEDLGWSYACETGETDLLRTLLTGPWDEARFLVLEPGFTAHLSDGPAVVEARKTGNHIR